MDIHDDASNEGRVLRPRRKRIVSIDSEASSRPSTPLATTTTTTTKIEDDVLPKRTTRRSSISRTPQKTPSKAKNTSIIDLDTPVRTTRRLSQLITDVGTPNRVARSQTPLAVLPEENVATTKNKASATGKRVKSKSPQEKEGKQTRGRAKRRPQYVSDSDDEIEFIDISNHDIDTKSSEEEEDEPSNNHNQTEKIQEQSNTKSDKSSSNETEPAIGNLCTPSKGSFGLRKTNIEMVDTPENNNHEETPSKSGKLKTSGEIDISRKSVVRLERMPQLTLKAADENEPVNVSHHSQDENGKMFEGFDEDKNDENPSETPIEAQTTTENTISNSLHAKVISVVVFPPHSNNTENTKSPQKDASYCDTSNLSKSTNEQSKSMHSKSVTFEASENLDESKKCFPKTPGISKHISYGMSSKTAITKERSLKLSDSVMDVDEDEDKHENSNVTEEHIEEEEKVEATAELSMSKIVKTPQKTLLKTLDSHCSTPNLLVDNVVGVKTPTPEKLLRSGKNYSPSSEVDLSSEKDTEKQNITEKINPLTMSKNSNVDGDENDENLKSTEDKKSIEHSDKNKSDNCLQSSISTLQENVDTLEKEELNAKDIESENPENSQESLNKEEHEKAGENNDGKEEEKYPHNNSNEHNAMETADDGLSGEVQKETTESEVEKKEYLYSRTWMQCVKNSSTKIDTLCSAVEKSSPKPMEIVNRDNFDYKLQLKDDSDTEEELDEDEEKKEDNEFVENEAMDMGESYQSGDSMNEEEKEYAAECFEPDDGESIGSKDTSEDEPEDDHMDDNNSFIVHSDEDADEELKMLEYSDDNEHLMNGSPGKGKVYKRLKKMLSDSEDEDADAFTYDVTHMIDETIPNQYQQMNESESEDAVFSNDENEDNEMEKQNEKNEKYNNRRSINTSLAQPNENVYEDENSKAFKTKQNTPEKRRSGYLMGQNVEEIKNNERRSIKNEYYKENLMADEESLRNQESSSIKNTDENTESEVLTVSKKKQNIDLMEDNNGHFEDMQCDDVNSNKSDFSENEENTKQNPDQYSSMIESGEGYPGKEKRSDAAKNHRLSMSSEKHLNSQVEEEHSVASRRSRNNSLSKNESHRSRKISFAGNNGFTESNEENISLNQSNERENEQEHSAQSEDNNSSKENYSHNVEHKINPIAHGSRHSDFEYKLNKKRADREMRHKSFNEAEYADLIFDNSFGAMEKRKSQKPSLVESKRSNVSQTDEKEIEENVDEFQMENNCDGHNSRTEKTEKYLASKIGSRSYQEENAQVDNSKVPTLKRKRSKSFAEASNESSSSELLKKPSTHSLSIAHGKISHVNANTEETGSSGNVEAHLTTKMKLSFEETTGGRTKKIHSQRTSTPFIKKCPTTTNESQNNISKILEQCNQMMDAFGCAKKQLRENNPTKGKKKKSDTVEESSEDITSSTVDELKRSALQQAFKASQKLLNKRNEKRQRDTLESQNDKDKYASKRLPADMLAAILSSDGEPSCQPKKRKKNNSSEPQQISQKVYKSASGDVIVESPLSPPQPKKSKVEVIKTSSGEVRVEPITPMAKKIKDPGFRESPITPRATGWRMEQFLKSNTGLNQSPVSTAIAGRKRKRHMDRIPKNIEPTNTLPQPSWTKSAGNFKIEKIRQTMKILKPTGATEFAVVALGENVPVLGMKISMKTSDNSSTLSATERAMQFRQNAVYRDNIPREDTRNLLRRKRFVH